MLNAEGLFPKEQGVAVIFNIEKLLEWLLSEIFRIMRRLQLRSSFFSFIIQMKWMSTKLKEIKENVIHCVQSALKRLKRQILQLEFLKALNNFMATNTSSYAY